MNHRISAMALLLCVAGVFTGPLLSAKTGIIGTKHDLSSKTGPGPVKAFSEDRICVFCHTPHNASPQTPLWNKDVPARNYTLYNSTTMLAAPTLPTGPSRLCLGCHDGILALGEVRSSGDWDASGKPVPINMMNVSETGGMPPGRPSYLGLSLAGDHPISFPYSKSLPNTELSPVPPPELLFSGSGVIHCTTCHDPHDNTNNKFLAVNNVASGLCTLCHKMNGWSGTPHSWSLDTWNGASPDPWPRTGSTSDFNWTSVKKNGCENCHAPHNAVSRKRLLNCSTELGPCNPPTEEGTCYPCHNGNMVPAIYNIFGRFNSTNTSRHAVDLYTGAHDPTESPRYINNHVECVDCHNPHMTNNNKTVAPPYVSGRLDGVSGVTIDNDILKTAVNEYEICFKCHASSTAQTMVAYTPVTRVIREYNTRLEFQTNNASFHPVAGPNESTIVPSLIAPLTTSSAIYCTDCHSDASGSRGPHGSQYAPILRKKYITTDNNGLYSYSNFELCYDCHYESSLLSDNTFQKKSGTRGGHSGHLKFIIDANNVTHNIYTTCAACHDPHGIQDNHVSGSHKRLINFSTQPPYPVVSALTGSSGYPEFSGTGNGVGSCTLVCHGVEHREGTHSYP